MLEANRRTNLTGAASLEAIVGEHILDSLAPLQDISIEDPVIDLGSGAGFPGIPAAIVFPKKRFILIEPRAKRAAFLEAAVEWLELENTAVLKSSAQGPRAELLAGTSGTVLMRAVAGPEKALQIGLPLLRGGGRLILYEGRAATPTAAHRAIARKHAATIRIRKIRVPGLSAVRHAWIAEKRR